MRDFYIFIYNTFKLGGKFILLLNERKNILKMNFNKYMFLPVALLLFIFIACDVLESSTNDLEVQEKDNVAQVINKYKKDKH